MKEGGRTTMAVKRSVHPQSRWNQGWSNGSQDGYRLGWNYGHRLGKSEAVIRSTPRLQAPLRKLPVLLVTSGMGFPFSPIDHAVTAAMRKQVSELHICAPSDDLVLLTARIRPKLVVVLLGMHVSTDAVQRIRALGATTVIWYSDDPYYTDVTKLTAPHYDLVFTNELSCVDYYRKQGCAHVHHLPLAVELSEFCPMRVHTGYFSDICFIGSAYWYRVGFFDKIAPYLASKHIRIFGWWWQRLTHYPLLAPSICTEWLAPEETARYYNGAKIVINLHRSPDDETFNQNSSRVAALSINPRTFEICGTGAFQLTDERNDLTQFYSPGHDLATYSSAEDLVQKIEYYLQHEEERNEIALRGLQKTAREHTFDHRVAAMLQVVMSSP